MPLAEFTYMLRKVERGYNNRTLHVDLTHSQIRSKPVTEYMKDTFIGGRGFNLWLLWNSLPKNRLVRWDDPENAIQEAERASSSRYPR